MMKFIFVLLCLILSVIIFKSDGKYRIITFIFGIFFIRQSFLVITNPGITSHVFFILTYIASLYCQKTLKSSWSSFPLKELFIVYAMATFVICIFTEFLMPLQRILRWGVLLLTELGPLFVGYTIIREEKDKKVVTLSLVIFSILACLYGFYVYVTGYSVYDELMAVMLGNDIDDIEYYLTQDESRGARLGGIIGNSHVWGFVTGLFVTFILGIIEKNNYKFKYIAIVSILMLAANMLLSRTRAGILSGILGVIFLTMFSTAGLKKRSITFFLIFCVGIILFDLNILDFNLIFSTFQSNGEYVAGSDYDLKISQFHAAYNLMLQNPLLGNGVSYFREVLIHLNRYDMTVMGGFEGCHLLWMVERGVLYTCFMFYFIYRQFAFGKKLDRNNPYKLLYFSVLLIFWFNAFSVGYAGKYIFAMFLIGVSLKLGLLYEENKIN